jgi:hypothetical protein
MEQIIKEGKAELIKPKETDSSYKEVYLLTYNHQKYILIKCGKKKTADRYEKNYNIFEKFGFFPELLWRDKTRLIFEYIPGRDCKMSDALQVAGDVGGIVGVINSIKIPIKQYNFDKNFFKKLNYIKKRHVLNSDKIKEIRDKYYELKSKANPILSIDAKDIKGDNFRLYNGKVYFVDIDAIRPALRGLGIAKAMLHWFKIPIERELFFKGYNKFSDSSFFTTDYRDFIFLYFIIKEIHSKYTKKRLISQRLETLDKFLLGERL